MEQGGTYKFTLGIDVGGTKTAYGLFDEDKKLLGRTEHRSDVSAAPEDFFDNIAFNVGELLSQCKISGEESIGIGLAMPSFILYEKGYIVKTSNLPKIKDFPARDYLSKKLGLPVVLDNDARAAGIAEYRHGAGRGFDKMFYCPISTGISSALIIEGVPFRGSYGWAGESGHMIATPGEGLLCGCGNRGCYMSWCSGSMIVRHIAKWIEAGEKTVMTELAKDNEIDSFILERAYDMGDPMAEKALKQMIHYLALWFYNLYVSFNVNCYVLGGGLVKMGEKLLTPIEKLFHDFNQDEHTVHFKTALCGENTGILGAAELLSIGGV